VVVCDESLGLAGGRQRVAPVLVERIGIVVSSVVALFLISPLLRVPVLTVPLTALGTPLRLGISRHLVVGVVAGLVTWVGMHAVLILHPGYAPGTRVYSHRLLPALTAVAAAVFWQRQASQTVEGQLVAAALIGLALSLVMLAQFLAADGESPWVVRLRTVLSVVSLAVGLYLLIMIYETRARSLVTATAAALLTGAIAIDIMQYEAVSEWRLLRAAALIGLILGECAWALNYWRLSPLRAGFILFTVIYLLVGLTRRYFHGSSMALAVLEHAIMALLLLYVMSSFTL